MTGLEKKCEWMNFLGGLLCHVVIFSLAFAVASVHIACKFHNCVLWKFTLHAGWPYIWSHLLLECPLFSTKIHIIPKITLQQWTLQERSELQYINLWYFWHFTRFRIFCLVVQPQFYNISTSGVQCKTVMLGEHLFPRPNLRPRPHDFADGRRFPICLISLQYWVWKSGKLSL